MKKLYIVCYLLHINNLIKASQIANSVHNCLPYSIYCYRIWYYIQRATNVSKHLAMFNSNNENWKTRNAIVKLR